MAKSPPKADSMDQVRDLLLGTQLKDMETRFQRQEEHFLREISDLQNSFKNRLESLENFMKSETTSLLHRLQEEQSERGAALKNEQRERLESIKAEQRERAESLRNEQRERNESLAQITKDLANLEEASERKLAALSGTLDAAERELRQLLLSENSRLSEKVEEKYKDALNALSKTAAQIRHDMASRSAVSNLLTEMAVKLSGQWPMDVTAIESSEEEDTNEEPQEA